MDHGWRATATAIMDQMEEEAEDEAQQEPAHQCSPFESLMIQKMDAMLHLHQEHSVDVNSTLENITTRLENIETRITLSNLLNSDKDEAWLCSCAWFCCLLICFVLCVC